MAEVKARKGLSDSELLAIRAGKDFLSGSSSQPTRHSTEKVSLFLAMFYYCAVTLDIAIEKLKS
jgi:hypothetical protein